MRLLAAIPAALLVTVLLAQAGCKNKTERITSPAYMLDLLSKRWAEARQTLQSDRPNLGVFRTLDHLLRFRLPRRIEKAYSGDDKQQLLGRLRELGRAYRDQIQSRLDMRGNEVRLAPGVTLEQFRHAFAGLDEQYRQLESMTGGG